MESVGGPQKDLITKKKEKVYYHVQVFYFDSIFCLFVFKQICSFCEMDKMHWGIIMIQ